MRLGPMLIIVAIAFLMMASAGRADDKTPLDEAKMLAIKAADLIVAKGVDDARSVFHQDGEVEEQRGIRFLGIAVDCFGILVHPLEMQQASQVNSCLQVRAIAGETGLVSGLG